MPRKIDRLFISLFVNAIKTITRYLKSFQQMCYKTTIFQLMQTMLRSQNHVVLSSKTIFYATTKTRHQTLERCQLLVTVNFGSINKIQRNVFQLSIRKY